MIDGREPALRPESRGSEPAAKSRLSAWKRRTDEGGKRREILQADPPDGQCAISFPAIHLSLGHWVPAEVQLPVEASIRHVGSRHVLKGIVADHVNDGAHHRFPKNTHTRRQSGLTTHP